MPGRVSSNEKARRRILMTDREILIRVFAEAMVPKVEWLRAQTGTKRQISAVLSSLTQEIRKLCDALASDDLRPAVSQRAAAVAREIGVDLYEQTWHTQTRFDPGRRVFHLEHVVPVEAVRAGAVSAANVDAIIRVLHSLKIAWILKEEDATLTRLGYGTRRPDPVSAYAHAEIVLIDGKAK